MPRSKYVEELEDCCVVRFREEALDTGDDTL